MHAYPGQGNRRIRTTRYRGLWLLAGLLIVPAGWAEEWQFGGHAKYQYTVTDYARSDLQARYGDDPAATHQADLRLKAEKRSGSWDAVVHYEVLTLHGDTLETRRALAAAGFPLSGSASGLPDDERRLFNLTSELADRPRTAAVQRLDRLSLGYGSERLLVRFGRQAVSWGNGLVFQPLDFLNPFSPITIDKDYKTGDDMLYGQWQGLGQGDVQIVAVPRREALTHEVTGNESSHAAKLRQRLGGFDVDLLAARHYGQGLYGLGLVHSVGGAVWRLDVAALDLPATDTAWSMVTNLDYSWTLFGRNMYGLVEYFRSGLGAARESGYSSPDPALTARLARGELYTLGRDYAVLGLQVEFSPLVNGFGNLIQNLNDGSRFLQLRGVHDWRQDVQLQAGVNLPAGRRGSEYGGLPAGLPGVTSAPGRSFYLRAAYYF